MSILYLDKKEGMKIPIINLCRLLKLVVDGGLSYVYTDLIRIKLHMEHMPKIVS